MVDCATLSLERSTLVLGAFSGVLGFSGVGLVDSSGTVSYTHLDVYKRQV